MEAVIARARTFVGSQEAATATEYAVMMALILTVVIVAVQNLGTTVLGLHAATVDALP